MTEQKNAEKKNEAQAGQLTRKPLTRKPLTRKPLTRTPLWKRPIFSLFICVFVFIGLRGLVIAKLMGGHYSAQSFFQDSLAGLLILLALQGLDASLTYGLKRLIGDVTQVCKLVLRAIRLAFVVLVCGTFLLAAAQLHPPKVGCVATPVQFGMQFTEHTIEAEDGVEISAWSIPVADPERSRTRPVMVVTHGLGANKQNFLHITTMLHDLDYNIVTFDFRGHGDSGGRTCTLGVHEGRDVKAAYDLAVHQFPNRPVYCWSTSMGGAATLRAAAEHQIFDKIVVDATFTSVRNVAMETKFCYLGPLGKSAWQLSRLWYGSFVGDDIDGYGPEHDIANVMAPLFLIHGTADPIIPSSHSERLHRAACEGTELWLVEGAGHCGSFHHPDYPQRVLEFFEGEVDAIANR